MGSFELSSISRHMGFQCNFLLASPYFHVPHQTLLSRSCHARSPSLARILHCVCWHLSTIPNSMFLFPVQWWRVCAYNVHTKWSSLWVCESCELWVWTYELVVWSAEKNRIMDCIMFNYKMFPNFIFPKSLCHESWHKMCHFLQYKELKTFHSLPITMFRNHNCPVSSDIRV